MYLQTRYLNSLGQRLCYRHLQHHPALLQAPWQRVQFLPQTRAVDTFASPWKKLRTVGVTDDQLTISRQKPVLAVLQAYVQMRATVAINPDLPFVHQGKNTVLAALQWIESARLSFLQLVDPAQGKIAVT